MTACYLVSNAGTSTVNGIYEENGTLNEKPCYEIVGGGYWIYFHNIGGPFYSWDIGTTAVKEGDASGYYEVPWDEISTTPQLGTYPTFLPGGGEDPAAFVAIEECPSPPAGAPRTQAYVIA